MLDKRTRLCLLLLLVVPAGACQIGTTPISVEHSAFQMPHQAHRTGDILVRRFIDDRDPRRGPFIGAMQKSVGASRPGDIRVQDGETLEHLLTNYFAEALEDVGYNVHIEGEFPDEPSIEFLPVATVEGHIKKFWFEMLPLLPTGRHEIAVRIRVINSYDEVFWENQIRGEKVDVLWVGLHIEFEEMIRKAMDQALARAIDEFSTDQFAESIRLAEQSDVDALRASMPDLDSTSRDPDLPRLAETSARIFDDYKTVHQLERYLAQPPDACLVMGDIEICGWDFDKGDVGWPALSKKLRSQEPIALACVLPSNGRLRAPDTCHLWKRRSLDFQSGIERGRLVLGLESFDTTATPSRQADALLHASGSAWALSVVLGEWPHDCRPMTPERIPDDQICQWFLTDASPGFSVAARIKPDADRLSVSCPFSVNGRLVDNKSCIVEEVVEGISAAHGY